MSVFSTKHIVRFSEVDAAAIVFYPRYFEMINGVVEDWFAQSLDMPFNQMHADNNSAVPTVETSCQFMAPSRLGDELTFNLAVVKLGTSSLKLRVDAMCQGEQRFVAQFTIVYVENGADSITSKPFPDSIRPKILAYTMPVTQKEPTR